MDMKHSFSFLPSFQQVVQFLKVLKTLQLTACHGCMSQVGYPKKKLELLKNHLDKIEQAESISPC